jgi:hypothetical protein
MTASDDRPPISVGHVVLESDRVVESAGFMRVLGMRPVFQGPTMAIFELRGGTHLLIFPKGTVPGGAAEFDLMVENLRSLHQQLTDEGVTPSAIESVPTIHHERFTVREPGGVVLTVLSSHVEGRAV